MASTYLTRTPSSAGNRKTFTWSAWVKRCEVDATHYMVTQGTDSNNNWTIVFDGANKLQTWNYVSAFQYNLKTEQVFRDVNAWYHIVVAVDTTQATASDRVKLYVNGEQITSFVSGQETYPSQNADMYVNSTSGTFRIGFYTSGSSYFNGYMSHVHFIDGTAYTPSAFGETDSTTGEWKIKTSPSVTYGTNGWFMFKDDNSLNDDSGQGNNFTLGGGTLTKSEDNPSNVFATLNPLNAVYISFLQGNNTISGGNNGTDYSYIGSTLGASSGKFYWEVKVADLAEIDQVGVALASSGFSNIANSGGLQATTFGGKGFQFSNGNKVGDGSQSAYMGAFSTDDIGMIALDLDNNKITFGRNGQWSDGAGSCNQTYANSTPAFTNLTAGETYMPAHAMRGYGGNTGISRYNFGNGYFATTAVSSAGTNASGNGIFEYDVPTGFTALSTKGMNL